MTALQWKQLQETVAQMTSEEKERLAALLHRRPADESAPATDPLLGLMADESELVDQVVKEAHTARELHPLRTDH